METLVSAGVMKPWSQKEYASCSVKVCWLSPPPPPVSALYRSLPPLLRLYYPHAPACLAGVVAPYVAHHAYHEHYEDHYHHHNHDHDHDHDHHHHDHHHH